MGRYRCERARAWTSGLARGEPADRQDASRLRANQDTGDFVVIINAAKVRLTGSKLQGKVYYRHTEWPGGIRKTTAGKMLDAKPERLLEIAVKGMLPKNRLGHQIFNKLKVYRGAEHPHAAQKPKSVSV